MQSPWHRRGLCRYVSLRESRINPLPSRVNDSLTNRPLHEQAPTSRFSDRVADYVKYRPTYPDAAIDAVLRNDASPEQLTAADVGAGTGISSRLLAARGVRVFAVEPNEAMALEIGSTNLLTWVKGTAECTNLPAGSVDVVVCAQAFHWFRHAEALQEFRRVLRPTGWVSLMWNMRDESDPLTAAYTQAIRNVIGSEPAEMRGFDESMLDNHGFAKREIVAFPHEQWLDEAGFIGRAISASYVPKSGPGYEQLVAELRAIHAHHAGPTGVVAIRYTTRVYVAEKR